jgi:hypothetical protein
VRIQLINRSKDQDILAEASVISKKMKEQKRLEKQEMQVLERLKQTYAKQ